MRKVKAEAPEQALRVFFHNQFQLALRRYYSHLPISGDTMQTYKLVYDATAFDPGRWGFLGAGVLFMCIGLVLLRFRGKPRVTWLSNWPPHPVFAWFFFLFSTFWTAVVGFSLVHGWLEVDNAVANKAYHVVTGQVTDFKPMPKEGHADESFTVQGVHFHYSDFEITSGFRNTEAYGGPIHANSKVMLGYICKPSEADCSDPLIVRVEVTK